MTLTQYSKKLQQAILTLIQECYYKYHTELLLLKGRCFTFALRGIPKIVIQIELWIFTADKRKIHRYFFIKLYILCFIKYS
jgi:hypothetical protein